MKLVVGLGNPGRKYEGTRHNVGYMVLAELARRAGSQGTKAAFQGELADIAISVERTLLLWPHTYMNRSGMSVLAARDFYKLNNDDVLIVCDDLHLPLGKLRFRPQGSAGGQKGLADVIRVLGTEDVPRLRIGIDEAPPGWNAADYVLARFSKQDQSVIDEAIVRGAEGVETWVRRGIQECMNQYN
ncbi:MAG TPA: aminoacyl-tRNA hydrolase [Pirellulales bacterium]|nr:aminoacyl-tRNA hydrolase [Pirellulales bacterium]